VSGQFRPPVHRKEGRGDPRRVYGRNRCNRCGGHRGAHCADVRRASRRPKAPVIGYIVFGVAAAAAVAVLAYWGLKRATAGGRSKDGRRW